MYEKGEIGLILLVIMIPIITLLIAHYLGDFICQSRKMAENKSTSLKVLSQHVAVYTGVLIASLWISKFIMGISWFMGISYFTLLYYGCINGILHFIVDYFTSKAAKKAFENNNIKRFWNIIGLDQLLHGAMLLFTYIIMAVFNFLG